ncbi:MAG: type II toxin-antitoxin system HicB family antitoxin [Magnetococcales bacterium]|nr:type II toxin-antitoxin system HicB family antitoxin [Magnetococcales bacterium]
MWNYVVELTPAEEGGFVVTFPDIPPAITQGEDRDEALLRARDALETALEFYIDDRKPLPVPSPAGGHPTVRPNALVCAKLAVYQAMQETGVRKAELARRLHWHLPQVDRLLDLRHASRLDQVETALDALGLQVVISVEAAQSFTMPMDHRCRLDDDQGFTPTLPNT